GILAILLIIAFPIFPMKKPEQGRSGAGLEEVEDNPRNLVELTRLVEKEIRAGIEAFLSILGIGKVGEDNDFGPRPRDLYGLEHVDPVAIRHPDVQNHDIGVQFLNGLYRLWTVGRAADQLQPADLLEQIRQALDHLE